jgi:hypothetical protein
VPDRPGHLADVALGHASLRGYLTSSPYFGVVVGRYANRIARGRFTLDGMAYRLATNDAPTGLLSRTFLIQRRRSNRLNSSNLLASTRVRVTRGWSLLT